MGVASLACAGGGAEEGLEPEIPFEFAAPDVVVVEKGDSLSLIAQRSGCTVDELKHWNQLADDTIEPGQELHVWNTGSGSRAKPKDGSARSSDVASAKPKSKPRPAPAAPKKSWNPLRAWVQGDDSDEETDDGVAAVDPVRVVEPEVEEEEEPVPEEEPRRPLLVRGAGVLGIDLGDDDGTDLEKAAAGMEQRSSELDGSALGQRGSAFENGGQADSFEVEGREVGGYGGVMIPDTPVKAPRLARPAAKRCLRGPNEGDLTAEHDAVTNQGLDDGQIRTGMSKVVRASTQCFPDGSSGSYRVIVELEVGCDGVTDDARVISAGPVPGNVTGCIEKTMEYAGFAAHARPNGVVFQYPLDYSF